ncbi:MAG: hypothetical protein IPK93_03840 [Solirubrobacterales bacterium]|nr:hypothetical protein [Solirubrobacterales bacterium]
MPDKDLNLNKALSDGRNASVFIVGPRAEVRPGNSAEGKYLDDGTLIELPRGWRVDSKETFPGVVDLSLVKVSRETGSGKVD